MTEKRRQQCRDAQRRYEQTAKGKATIRRYRQTEHGKAVVGRHQDRRLWVGQRYVGRVPTVEQADAINAHIKGRIRAFKGQSGGEKAEGVAAGPVPPEAAV